MTDYYTLDGQRSLREGMLLALDYILPPNAHPDRVALGKRLYPDGFSWWGKAHFFFRQQSKQSQNIELLWELVRLAEYPDVPSRFQCWFGMDSIEGLRDFHSRFRTNGGTVWEVSAASASRYDMTHLKWSDDMVQMTDRARDYWEGKASATPAWEWLLQAPIRVGRKVAEWGPGGPQPP